MIERTVAGNRRGEVRRAGQADQLGDDPALRLGCGHVELETVAFRAVVDVEICFVIVAVDAFEMQLCLQPFCRIAKIALRGDGEDCGLADKLRAEFQADRSAVAAGRCRSGASEISLVRFRLARAG